MIVIITLSVCQLLVFTCKMGNIFYSLHNVLYKCSIYLLTYLLCIFIFNEIHIRPYCNWVIVIIRCQLVGVELFHLSSSTLR